MYVRFIILIVLKLYTSNIFSLVNPKVVPTTYKYPIKYIAKTMII